MSNTFKCDRCCGVFQKGWSDEERDKEMMDNWGDLPKEDRASLCDDCYNDFMGRLKELALKN